MASSYEDFLGDSYDYNSQTFDADKAKQEAEEKKERFNSIPYLSKKQFGWVPFQEILSNFPYYLLFLLKHFKHIG